MRGYLSLCLASLSIWSALIFGCGVFSIQGVFALGFSCISSKVEISFCDLGVFSSERVSVFGFRVFNREEVFVFRPGVRGGYYVTNRAKRHSTQL